MPEDEQAADVEPAGSERPATALSQVVANVGNRIQEILDMAERVANEIRTDAEVAGANLVEERRREADRVVAEYLGELTAMTQALSARAASVEREASALITEIEQVRRRLSRLVDVDASPAPAINLHTPPPPAPPERPSDRIPEQAVLRATQMAVAGSERAEIERMLRGEFGIDDPASVVGDMLGSERRP